MDCIGVFYEPWYLSVENNSSLPCLIWMTPTLPGCRLKSAGNPNNFRCTENTGSNQYHTTWTELIHRSVHFINVYLNKGHDRTTCNSAYRHVSTILASKRKEEKKQNINTPSTVVVFIVVFVSFCILVLLLFFCCCFIYGYNTISFHIGWLWK